MHTFIKTEFVNVSCVWNKYFQQDPIESVSFLRSCPFGPVTRGALLVLTNIFINNVFQTNINFKPCFIRLRSLYLPLTWFRCRRYQFMQKVQDWVIYCHDVGIILIKLCWWNLRIYLYRLFDFLWRMCIQIVQLTVCDILSLTYNPRDTKCWKYHTTSLI